MRNAHGEEGGRVGAPSPARSFKRGGAGVNLATPPTLARLGLRAYSKAMSSERAVQALERIERAIARLEQAATPPRGSSVGDGQLEQLRQTHQALRGQVEGAIAQIDRLLANGGGM